MRQQEQIISANRHETAIVYDSKGNIVRKQTGTQSEVAFSIPKGTHDGLVITHNHPNQSVFSGEDVFILNDGRIAEVRACNNRGTYVLKLSQKWPDELSSASKINNELNDLFEVTLNQYNEIAAQNGENFLKYFQQADEESFDIFCKKYGFDFTWEDYT